jgi:probable rRNA maturation factor
MPVHIERARTRRDLPSRPLAAYLRGCLQALGRPRGVLCLSLVGDDEIAALNAEWRGQPGVTDVLSFAQGEGEPMPGGGELLGDVVISVDTAARQAAALQAALDAAGAGTRWGLAEEVAFLATHGLLHLLGHDHQGAAEAAAMEALERKLLAPLSAVDPHQLDRSAHGVG